MNALQLWNHFNACNPYQSQGFITDDLARHFQNYDPQNENLTSSKRNQMMHLTLLCFNKAFLRHGWKQRNHATHNVQGPLPLLQNRVEVQVLAVHKKQKCEIGLIAKAYIKERFIRKLNTNTSIIPGNQIPIFDTIEYHGQP